MAPRGFGDRRCGLLRLAAPSLACRARRPSRRSGPAAPCAASARADACGCRAGYGRACSSQASRCAMSSSVLHRYMMPHWRKPVSASVSVVHALPQPQALDDQRDLARIAPHLAAPAPVAARLLAGDVALLAQHDRDALAGEEERRAGADDAAADDDDVGARGQFGIGRNWIDARRHDVSPTVGAGSAKNSRSLIPYGRACPGHQQRHSATSDGRDKPDHDG